MAGATLVRWGCMEQHYFCTVLMRKMLCLHRHENGTRHYTGMKSVCLSLTINLKRTEVNKKSQTCTISVLTQINILNPILFKINIYHHVISPVLIMTETILGRHLWVRVSPS